MTQTRQVFFGQEQYQTVQEALAADLWLTTWRAQNYALIRQAGTGQNVSALIPAVTNAPNAMPGDPPANGQLTWTVHLEGETDAINAAVWEVQAAITQSIGDDEDPAHPAVLHSVQDSTCGSTGE